MLAGRSFADFGNALATVQESCRYVFLMLLTRFSKNALFSSLEAIPQSPGNQNPKLLMYLIIPAASTHIFLTSRPKINLSHTQLAPSKNLKRNKQHNVEWYRIVSGRATKTTKKQQKRPRRMQQRKEKKNNPKKNPECPFSPFFSLFPFFPSFLSSAISRHPIDFLPKIPALLIFCVVRRRSHLCKIVAPGVVACAHLIPRFSVLRPR
jgi:hypothetical protein